MNELIKTFEDKQVRIVVIDDEPYFVVNDVCKVLDIANPWDTVNSIDQDTLASTEVIDSIGRKRKTNIVNESGLYEIIFRSRRPEAKAFKKWVFSEVLPQIRKTGSYQITDSLKDKSTKARNMLTAEWDNHGVKEGWQYGKLTLEEYRLLQFEKGKRKKDLDDGELKTLLALEAMEMLSLHYNPVEGYIECKNNLKDTAQKVIEVKNKEQIDADTN